MLIQVSMLVGNVSDLLAAGFTHIEVHHSTDYGSSYKEATAPVAQPAVLRSLEAATRFRMGGARLSVQVDGGPVQVIDFNTIVEDWSPAQVAARINEVVADLASVDGQRVALTSPTTGRASSVRIAYCDAWQLGLTANQEARGFAQRLPLVPGTLLYSFVDPAGGAVDRYKWRFSKGGLEPVSDFSAPVFGSTSPVASPAQLSVCTAHFVSLTGRPRKVRIIVGMPETPVGIDNMFVGEDASLVVDSDDNGFLQLTLVRGTRVRVAIEGTLYVREFVVPDAPTFDLKTVMASAPDPFTVQRPASALYRRSL